MKKLAALLMFLMLCACLKPPAQPPEQPPGEQVEGLGEIGIEEGAEPGLEELPEVEEESTGLTGGPVDLGSLI